MMKQQNIDNSVQKCADCALWKYDKHVEERYGMGSGLCQFDGDVKGCDRRACLAFRKRQTENERQRENLECFLPEKDNPYPLCVGRGREECVECQLRADWEPEGIY